ncbi:hypothetical protein UPYG_G00313850 [Umbra pygmaea]|uniref:Uncharacterized protein n=1 Tax=Umbra pygmaea TaxID=75934 RepID=A0ABD0WMJ3_UMBPY
MESDTLLSLFIILYMCFLQNERMILEEDELFRSERRRRIRRRRELERIEGQLRRSSRSRQASTLQQLPATRDVGCQTDPLQRHNVGTKLSFKILQPHISSEAVQATVSCKEFGVGTSTAPYAATLPVLSTPIKRTAKRPCLDLKEKEEDPFEGSSSVVASQGLDATYDPADSNQLSGVASSPTHKIKKFIVYETCIMELFEVCPVCQRVCNVRTQRLGTFLSVKQLCPHCQFSRHWNSQPLLGSTPAGNIHLSAAVYVSGVSFSKLEKIFKALQLQIFQYDTFRWHAKNFIEPAIVNKWKTSQDMMLQRLSEEDKVIVGGDMRADSPGQSAKFGSYTMMDLKTNTVVDIQLVQSNEVGGSYHMEIEGLQRSLALLDAHGVTLDCIVTDRHLQIQKFLRESNITQFYDVWHVEKGISKQLEKDCRMKDCGKLQHWRRSIKNHIYWTAASSTTGPERVAKWTSILNHVQDIHIHEDPIFSKCLHPLRKTTDKSKWLTAATPAFYKLQKVMTNKRILKDVAKLSPHHQTSSFEAFHSVILRFAPKNVVFPFLGMLCRLYLAALYYNENAGRPQATTSAGDPLFKVHLPKGRKGECRAKPVKTEPTFRYVDDLMDLIFDKVFVDPAPYIEEVLQIPIPPDLCAQYE